MKSILTLIFFGWLCTFAIASNPVLSKQQIISKKPADFFSLNASDKEFLVTIDHVGTKRMPKDRLQIWIPKEKGFESLYSFNSGIGETFEKPDIFTINGFNFLDISTSPSGSGGFVQRNIFWIAPNNYLQPVDWQSASQTYENLAAPGEVILNGGEKEFYIQDNQMKFQFYLAHDGDPHCCPTAGLISGTYKLVGSPKYDFFERKYVGKLEIQIDQFEHKRRLNSE